jgi:alkaline phosphatase D
VRNRLIGPLKAGPLLGEQGDHDAFIWAQAMNDQPLTLTLFRPDGIPVDQQTKTPQRENHNCVLYQVTGFDMIGTYEYQLSTTLLKTERIKMRRPPRPDGKRVRIVFGSCIREPDATWNIFQKMASEGADLVMFVGDNTYFEPHGNEDDSVHDADNEKLMMEAHLRWRQAPGMRELCDNVSTLAIWDDHDYGRNDAGGDNPKKFEALGCFKRMWANRHYGLPDEPGVFSTVRCGPAQIFLLDVRFKRLNGKVISTEQMHWLKHQLMATDAPVKLIVSGSQMLPSTPATARNWECWKRDGPNELDELLTFIAEHPINGVILATGDVHLGHLMFSRGLLRQDGRRGGDVWELTSSPLTGDTEPGALMHGHDRVYDPYLIQEVVEPNYGVIDINLEREDKEIALELKSVDSSLFRAEIDLETLRVRPPRAPKVRAFATGAGHSKAFFFRGDKFVEYDIASRTVTSGPHLIESRWPGLNPEFSAGTHWPIGKTFFFRNNGCKVWGMPTRRDGTSTYIADFWHWPLEFQTGIDAALLWIEGKAYFFKGKNYIRYDVINGRVDGNYPQPIARWWKGIWPEGIDAAFLGPNGKAYFFRGDEYIRFDIHDDGADGPPKPIANRWPGLTF